MSILGLFVFSCAHLSYPLHVHAVCPVQWQCHLQRWQRSWITLCLHLFVWLQTGVRLGNEDLQSGWRLCRVEWSSADVFRYMYL